MKQKFRNNLDAKAEIPPNRDLYNPISRPLVETYAEIYRALQEDKKVSLDHSFEYFFRCLLVTYDGVVLDWCYNNGDYDLPEAIKRATKRYVSSFKPG